MTKPTGNTLIGVWHATDRGRSFVPIMKQPLLLLSAVLFSAAGQAQTPVTVSTQATNAEQVWYSLQNGEVGNAALDEWDLAFEMTGFAGSIRVNTAKGLTVYETPAAITDWDAVNSVDTANWTLIENSDSSWSAGALTHGNNLDDPEGFDLGWGDYNIVTHAVIGSKIYAIGLADGTSWMKLRINSLTNGVYSFTYADLDGTDSHDAEVVKTDFTGKNFGYYSFATNATMDREPLTADWDLLFTKYIGFVPTPYPVAGVLQNKEVTALQVDGVPTDDATWTNDPFSVNMNILGSDWKSYDFNTNEYTIATDRTYFVKDIPGNIWKIVFTAYGGSATGDMSFNQEMVSATGINEVAAQQGTLITYPNPVTDGQAQLIIDVPAHDGVMHVMNLAGQQMLQQQWSGLNGLGARTLDVSGLAKGVYILRFDAANSSTTGKLVIE
jgi:hypothetical protein